MTDRIYEGDVKDVRQIAEIQAPVPDDYSGNPWSLPPSLGPYSRLWQPALALWKKKHLIVVYGAGLEGKCDMGDMLCSVSTDDGDTWSCPVTVFDHRERFGTMQFGYANPVLYHPPGQNIVWCFAMRCQLHKTNSEVSQLCAAYTADGGRSWVPVELTVHHHLPPITCGGIVRVANGSDVRYLLPIHCNPMTPAPEGGSNHYLLESPNLLEWTLAGYIPADEEKRARPHEGNIDFGQDDEELKIVMRTGEYESPWKPIEPPTAYSSCSRDGGRTWSAVQPEPELYNTVSKAFYGRDSHGNHVYVFSPGPAWERKPLHYKIQTPDGKWGDERVFYDGNNRNSYPVLIEKEPGLFYAVWDSSNNPNILRSSIRFGKLHP